MTTHESRLLAVVTARGGSKRLPRKNIRALGGRPLIAWTLSAAIRAQLFLDVLVSTDDPEIAEIARTWGGSVPWLRPPKLASDDATSIDVVLHALDWFEGERGPVDGVVLLQPTSPFRTVGSILEAAALFEASGRCCVVSVSEAKPNPASCCQIEDGNLVPMLGWRKVDVRSQDMEPFYNINGAIYIARPEILHTHRTFFSQPTKPFIMRDFIETLDIDTDNDWRMAEYFCLRPESQ